MLKIPERTIQIKCSFRFIIILFLFVPNLLTAQAVSDTVSTTETIPDRLIDSASEFEEAVPVKRDSLTMPVADSSFLYYDSVREVSKTQLNSYLLNPDYAYANDPEYWKKQMLQKPGMASRFFSGPVFRWIIFLAVIGLVLFGIVQLARENGFAWISRNIKEMNPEAKDMSPEVTMDFEGTIRKYQEQGNYRLAIRFMYLRLIYTARETTGIKIRDSSTNAEITQAFGNHPQAGEFRLLASAYEYIFYGGFIPRPELYETLKYKFESFQKALTV